MSKLRIISLVTHMEAGGAQGAAMRVAAELRRRGHYVEVWFLYLKSPTYADQEGVRVLLKQYPKGLGDFVGLLVDLVKEIRAFNPDAVLSYTHYASTLGHIAARLVGVPVRVATMRNPSWSYPKVARFLNRVIGSLGFYTTNIAVSEYVRETFSSYPKSYRDCMKVIYNGVALRDSSLAQQEARTKFGLPQNVPLIVSVGRLHPQKNQVMLLSALLLLPNCHLAIAGDGELKEQLVSQAENLGLKERVHFMGEISPQSVPDFLRSGDVFAFPSSFEAFGFAVFEAVCVGLPLVVSDISALREVLGGIDGEPVGLLVPPDDAVAWATGIKRVLEDRELRETLVLRAKERAKLFSLEKMVDGYEKCLLGAEERRQQTECLSLNPDS